MISDGKWSIEYSLQGSGYALSAPLPEEINTSLSTKYTFLGKNPPSCQGMFSYTMYIQACGFLFMKVVQVGVIPRKMPEQIQNVERPNFILYIPFAHTATDL